VDETEHEAAAAGLVAVDDLERWHASLEAADAVGAFFAYGCSLLVAARVPVGPQAGGAGAGTRA
jgi:hypothetical protein